MRLEAVTFVDLDKAGVGEEDGLVAELLDRLRDPDRVQRRSEGRLGEEREPLCRHCRLLLRV